MTILVMVIALATATVALLVLLGFNTDEKLGGVADEGVQDAPIFEDQTVRIRLQVPNGVKKDFVCYLGVTAIVILSIIRFALLEYEIRLREKCNIYNIYNI